ncbi:50S ribosomal protein L35ae [Candidatus Woesearchaeota archaeon]|nr:50S ribosomal protein L35ae [Candidatus Woesearchaeota archaeon]
MEATVMNFRRGRHHQHNKQMILKVADTPEEAGKVIGKTATWTSPAGKKLTGKISGLHGRTGSVKVIFADAGLPGQALGQKVMID